ncbi:hypothetical protein AB0K09_26780 [Streptomyces sp. NPDC049577]
MSVRRILATLLARLTPCATTEDETITTMDTTMDMTTKEPQ